MATTRRGEPEQKSNAGIRQRKASDRYNHDTARNHKQIEGANKESGSITTGTKQ